MNSQFARLQPLTGHNATFAVERSEDGNLTAEEVEETIAGCYIEYVFGMKKTANVDLLRFATISAPPHIFVKPIDDEFKIYGPIFSIYFEIAKKLNYSMDGHFGKKHLTILFACQRPDLIVTLLWPQLSSMAELVIYQNEERIEKMSMLGLPTPAILSKALGVISVDHVACYAEPNSKTWYSFLTVFEPGIWLAVLVCFLVFGTLISFLSKSNSKTNSKNSKLNNFWILFRTLLTVPHLSAKKLTSFACHVIFCFEVLSFMLQQYLGSEMLSEFARNAGWLTIDSWDDLLNTRINIYAVNPDVYERQSHKEETIKNYFPKDSVYRKDFTSRLNLVPVSVASGEHFDKYLISLLQKTGSEKSCFMVSEASLKFGRNKFRSDSKNNKDNGINFHISKRGGEIQPYFLMTTHFATDRKKRATNFVVVTMKESGIYDVWMKSIINGYRSDQEEVETIGYKDLSLPNMSGAFHLAFLSVIISTFCLLMEYYVNKLHRKRLFVNRANI